MTQNPTFGDVDNGERLPAEFGSYSGPAGIRWRDGGREVSYLGEAPKRFPAEGKIDGQDVKATRAIPTRVNGFVVLWVPDV